MKNNPLSYSNLGKRLEEPVIVGMMKKALENPALVSLAAGFTDTSKLPVDLVQKAVQELCSRRDSLEYLQYGTNQGRPKLREETAKFLLSFYDKENATYIKPENIIISNGSQQSLYLAMQVLCNEGDIILVEGPSYFVLLELLRGMNVQALSMPMLENGDIDIQALDRMLAKMEKEKSLARIKGIYIISYFANPSSHSISEATKVSLGDLIRKWSLNCALIEDAAYRELYFDAPYPSLSILSIQELDGISRLYLGTYTKPFVSGFKIGYSCSTDATLLNKMLYVKGHQDFGSANFSQALLEIILQKNWYTQWLNELHPHYKQKVECFNVIAQEEKLADLGCEWTHPKGGLMLWLKGPAGFDTSIDSPFYKACLQNGVFYVPGDLCFAERNPKNCIRLSLGSLPLETLKKGLKRLISTLRQVL